MYAEFGSYFLGFIPNPFVRYVISGDRAHIKRGFGLFGLFFWDFLQGNNVAISGAGIRKSPKFIFFGDLTISDSNHEVIWKNVWGLGSKYNLLSNFEHHKQAHARRQENPPETQDKPDSTNTENPKEKIQDTKEKPTPEDEWYKGYELLDELVHIPALPEKLAKMLLELSGSGSLSPIRWYVKKGDYIKKGQVIGEICLDRRRSRRFFKPAPLTEEQLNICSPMYGRVHKEFEFIPHYRNSSDHLSGPDYYRRKLSGSQEKSSYDPVHSMMLIQKISGPDANHDTNTFSIETFIKPFNDIAWSWLRFEDKSIEQGGRIPLVDLLRRARIRSELISYDTMYADLVEENKKLERYACDIPFPSSLLMDAVGHEAYISETIHVKTGEWISKGDKIASYKTRHHNPAIISPVSGKIIFVGLGRDQLETLHPNSTDHDSFTSWSEEQNNAKLKENWPINLYDNKVYGSARTRLAIVQPEKGSIVNPDKYVQDSYIEIIDAARKFIDECDLSKKSHYSPLIEQEIQKVVNCKGEFLGGYEISATHEGRCVVSKYHSDIEEDAKAEQFASEDDLVNTDVSSGDEFETKRRAMRPNLDALRIEWNLKEAFTKAELNQRFIERIENEPVDLERLKKERRELEAIAA